MTSLSINQLKEALAIKEQIQTLESRLSQVLGGAVSKITASPAKRGPKTMSAEGRARVAEAQRQRWAKQKSTSATSPEVKPSKPAKKKRVISPEQKAKIAAAMKARWAKVKGTPVAKSAVKPSPTKKGGLTPEGRAKIVAALKARWAAKKAAGKK